jgi:hypothetical protein
MTICFLGTVLLVENTYAQAQDASTVFAQIAQENYDATKGHVTYGLVSTGSPCEVWINGLPGSFRVHFYLQYVARYGGALPGNSYYFLESQVNPGKLTWISWDGKAVELAFDPATYKILYFHDEQIGCDI